MLLTFIYFSFIYRLGLKEQKRKELYAKQGRGSQFTSRDQRDTWIQNELKSLSKAIKEKNEQIERLQEDLKVFEASWKMSYFTPVYNICLILQRDGRKRVELEKKIEEMTSEMENHRLSIDDHNKVFYDMKKRKDQLQTERSSLWRNETLVQQNLASSKEELAKSDQV